MKKLMTTMLAVAVGVSLHAVGMASTGTSFEGLDAGDYDINATTGELSAQEAGQTYWVTNGTDQTLTVVAGPSVATAWDDNPGVPTRPFTSGPQQKYLDIKTTLGNPVTRNVSVGGAGTSIGDGFYFDSLVKFTAFDGDQVVNLDGGKLAIWLKEAYDNGDSADPTGTNLVITAGYLQNNSAVQTNYTCNVSGVSFNDGGWHRVTVKAIGTIYDGDVVPGFVVYVDGVYATSDAAKGIDISALNDNASAFNVDGALFPSADQSSTSYEEISSVAFDGQGSVDDLIFTATAPAFAKDKEFFTIELGANVTSLTYSEYGKGLSVTITETTRLEYVTDLGVTVTGVTYAPGYMSDGISTSSEVTKTGDYYFPRAAEQSITANAKLAGAYVGDTGYANLADAIAAANAANSACTVKLAANADAGITVNNSNSGVIITLDLAGNDITGEDGVEGPAIYVEAGTLIVTNSTPSDVGVVTPSTFNDGGDDVLNAAVNYDDSAATVIIRDGIYNGFVYAASISGGKFLASENDQQELNNMIVEGYEATQVGDYYEVTEKTTPPLPEVAEHPWYDSANNGGPAAVVLAENLPGQTGNIVSAFHGQGSGNFLGLTYSTNPLHFDLFGVDGTNAVTTIHSVEAADLTTPGLRGVAISETLGVAMTLAYATTTTMYTFPLEPLVGGNGQLAVSKPSTHSFDAAAFSPDGNYLFSNALNGESSNQFYVKWSVAVDDNTGALALTKVGSISAGGRGRCMAYARIKDRDLVFALADTGKVVVIDMTGDDASAWTTADLITDLPAHSYGTLCVSGVNVVDSQGNPATPHLTVATSTNNGAAKVDVLNVYALTVPATGAVSASLTRSFNEDAMTAAGFGDISDANRYGNTVYVTDDESTIYFARPDNKLYAAQYAKYYAVTFVSGEGATTNEVSVAEGRLPTAPEAAEVTGKSFSAWDPTVVAVTADATYTALYTNNIYTITFVIGESSSSVQKEYGVEITSVPEPPVVPGYTGAWDDDPAGDTVTGDKTYTYTYSAETYEITFVNEIGADPAVTNYTIESGTITLPTPTTENMGVQFDGWTNATITAAITEFTPTAQNVGNFTLYAAWSSTGSSGYDGGDGKTFTIDPGAVSTVEAATGAKMTDTVAGTDMTYAQAYALGLVNESTGAVADLDATIELKDGKVIIGLSSTPKAAYTITLKVYEKASLTAAWPAKESYTYTLDSATATTGFEPDTGSAGAGFYKAEVSISNK